jgi:hypothetical protein
MFEGRNGMRMIITMIFGMLYIVVLTVTADAESKKPKTYKKSCDQICSLRTNGDRSGTQYGNCLTKCQQQR